MLEIKTLPCTILVLCQYAQTSHLISLLNANTIYHIRLILDISHEDNTRIHIAT